MQDCFITTNYERPYLFNLTYTALANSGFEPNTIAVPMLKRYFECEKRAKTDIYILCDDDLIPAEKDTLSRLVEIMSRYPEYSQLGLGWRYDMEQESHSPWIRDKGEEVWEMDHVGGCMAIRKGTIKDLGYKMEYNNYGDDRVMGQTARALGYKVGVVPSLYFHNLGANMSSIWKK